MTATGEELAKAALAALSQPKTYQADIDYAKQCLRDLIQSKGKEVEQLEAEVDRLRAESAAAPDLLAACEDAYGFIEYIYCHESHQDAKPFLDKLERAIAKAKGEQE